MVAGTRVVGGRYELVEVLGAGGMATVWRARDGVLHREVAVKLLSPQYAADPGFLARFEREARHAAALSHPGLVTIFDGGVTGDSPFIVMELVAGQTLRQVLDQAGTLAAAQAVRVAAAVCEALEAVHAAGLVHRDIKPANIVLSGGRVKVLDFGIARAGGTSGGTRTQAVLGTAAYLSPEQASGDPAGPQSDLYSLGCVLFEMLTGTPPFTADTAVALAYRHVHDDPPPPSARLPGLPAALDQITGRLLAKDPAARPAGAAAARAHLLAAMPVDQTAVLDEPVHRAAPPEAGPGTGPDEPGRGPVPARPTLAGPASRRWPLRPIETVLATALAASLITVLVLLLSRPAGTTAAPSAPPGRTAAGQPSPKPTAPSSTPATPAARRADVPPSAAAAAAFVRDLQASVAAGQVTQQAGQDMFNHLQQLLFGPTGQSSQQIDQQYAQLIQSYDQHRAQREIAGAASAILRRDINALGVAIGAR